jgi:ubiquitin-protein ligase
MHIKSPSLHFDYPPHFFQVCLSILNDDPDLGGAWAPSLTVQQVSIHSAFFCRHLCPSFSLLLTQVLLGVQELLAEPNIHSPAQEYAWNLLTKTPDKYKL